jgi:hypothetical protein
MARIRDERKRMTDQAKQNFSNDKAAVEQDADRESATKARLVAPAVIHDIRLEAIW